MKIQISSFGYSRSVIPNADLVLNARNIKNPYYVPNLRYRTGLDSKIHENVFHNPEIPNALLAEARDAIGDAWADARESYHVAFGCTAGKHRSVALAEALAVQCEYMEEVTDVEINHIDLVKTFNSHKLIKRLERENKKLKNKLAQANENIGRMKRKLSGVSHS